MPRNDEYLEAQVMTAPPHQLHLMVVDGAIRQARRGHEALQRETPDIETAHFALNSSREFVAELISGLNPEQAPEIVANLRRLFAFIYQNLVKADLDRDAQKAADALKILEMHRETWVTLLQQLQVEQHGHPENSSQSGEFRLDSLNDVA